MDGIAWGSELSRGLVGFAALASLKEAPRHGYDILTLLHSHGFDHVRSGTLYPLLRRLEEQGLIAHEWEMSTSGPGRKIFRLTETGQAELDNANMAWQRITHNLATLSAPQ